MDISTGSYSEASTCLKRYEYHQVLGLVQKPQLWSKPLRRGVWIHRALEAHHKGESILNALNPMIDFAKEHGVPEDDIQELVREINDILMGYKVYWRQHGKPWKVVSSEEPIYFEYGDHRYRATPDLIVEEDNELWLVESKSTADIPNAQWRAVDPQTALQFIACHSSGKYKVAGIIFNYLLTAKPSIPKFKKDGEIYANTAVTTTLGWAKGVQALINERGDDYVKEHRAYIDEQATRYVADGKFYQRYAVRRPVEMLKSTMRDVIATMDALTEAKRTGHYRRSFNVFSCPRFCPYNDLCATEFISGKPSILREELYMRETPEIRAAGRVA